MKSSEILRKALERMDGGKKWTQRGWYWESDNDQIDKCCALGAMMDAIPLRDGSVFDNVAYGYLSRCTGGERVAFWNDHAPDFSVIQQGFEKAIELAIAEGD